MKIVGTLIAIVLFFGVLTAFIYGAHYLWLELSFQWSLVENTWRPVVILISIVMFLCSLLIVIAVQSAVRNSSASSLGKANAYSHYLSWYVTAKVDDFSDPNTNMLHAVRNEMLLWGGNQVMKQFQLLFTEINQSEQSLENIQKHARHVYIEIQRDLGRRGTDKLRMLN